MENQPDMNFYEAVSEPGEGIDQQWHEDFVNLRNEFIHAGADPIISDRIAFEQSLKIYQLQQKNLQLQAEIKILTPQAEKDPLTGLYNRRKFIEEAMREIEGLKRLRTHTGVSILMIDVDKFKLVNDTYGHPVGDKVLQALANLLSNSIRKLDVLGRLGGEEFAIAIFHAHDSAIPPHQGADLAAERFRKTVEEDLLVVLDNGETIKSTISIGTYTSETGEEDLYLMLQRADKAVYAAKNSGRNKMVAWSTDLEKPKENSSTSNQPT